MSWQVSSTTRQIRSDEGVIAVRIQRFTLGCDAISGLWGPLNETYSRSQSILCELLQGILTNAVCGSGEDKVRTELGRNLRV